MEYGALTRADAASTARLVVEEGELLRAQGKETRASLLSDRHQRLLTDSSARTE